MAWPTWFGAEEYRNDTIIRYKNLQLSNINNNKSIMKNNNQDSTYLQYVLGNVTT